MAMVQQRVVVAEEAWRRAVKRLSRFTISELAAELRCSQQAARDHLTAMMRLDQPLVREDGRLGRKPIYAYIKPTDEGERFKAQRALRSVTPPEVMAAASAPVRDNSNVAQSKSRRVSAPAVRRVVSEAEATGWQFVPANGSSKARLTKGARMVMIPNTPRDQDQAADTLRQQLFGDPARFRRREAG